jgi:nucleoside-triphosphatase
MNERMIYILAGEIQTGKTTALLKWSENRNDVFGILTPVIDGKRFFMDAHSKNQFKMEADQGERETFLIGRFKFSKPAFEKAIQIIHDSIDKKGWLVIDEIGPLELRKHGFYNVINEVLRNHAAQILFVVRQGLVEKVTEFFELKKFHIIKKEEWEQL